MLERANRITVAKLLRDITSAGIIRYFSLCRINAMPSPLNVLEPKPEVGSHFNFSANTKIKPMPKKKLGMEIPIKENTVRP